VNAGERFVERLRRACRTAVKAFSSDQKVYIAAYDKVVYPDIVVVLWIAGEPTLR
jgi:hypothetical protein